MYFLPCHDIYRNKKVDKSYIEMIPTCTGNDQIEIIGHMPLSYDHTFILKTEKKTCYSFSICTIYDISLQRKYVPFVNQCKIKFGS